MALAEMFRTTIDRYDAGPTVVWVRGEHDLSTSSDLSESIAEAIALDGSSVVLDLSGVTFMDAAIVTIILRSNVFLREHRRSLLLRAPSAAAARILVACDLVDRVHLPGPAPVSHAADALQTWVEVPPVARVGTSATG
jgi:anti-anti-sigma factor